MRPLGNLHRSSRNTPGVEQLGQRDVEHRLHLVRAGAGLGPPGQDADERADERPARHRGQVVELADDLDGGGVEADLLLRLAAGAVDRRLARLDAAAGEADLALMRAQPPRPAGEHDVGAPVLVVQRDQHGRGAPGPGGAVDQLDVGRVGRSPLRQRGADVGHRRAAPVRRQVGPGGRTAGAGVERPRDLLVAAPAGRHRDRGPGRLLARAGPAGQPPLHRLPGRDGGGRPLGAGNRRVSHRPSCRMPSPRPRSGPPVLRGRRAARRS